MSNGVNHGVGRHFYFPCINSSGYDHMNIRRSSVFISMYKILNLEKEKKNLIDIIESSKLGWLVKIMFKRKLNLEKEDCH